MHEHHLKRTLPFQPACHKPNSRNSRPTTASRPAAAVATNVNVSFLLSSFLSHCYGDKLS